MTTKKQEIIKRYKEHVKKIKSKGDLPKDVMKFENSLYKFFETFLNEAIDEICEEKEKKANRVMSILEGMDRTPYIDLAIRILKNL